MNLHINTFNRINKYLAVITVFLLFSLPGCKSNVSVKQKVRQDIYYVSPKGNDNAGGKSEKNAWRSIKHAVSIAKDGGTIRVLPGVYEEQIEISQAGNRNQLKITGYKGKPVIDGKRKLNLGLWVSESKNVTFENFIVRNYTDIGIGAQSGKNIVFRNNDVNNNGFNAKLTGWQIEGYGIYISNIEGYLIENNNVYENGPNPKRFPKRLMGTGINTFGSKNGVIKNNNSYKNTGGGILVEDSVNIVVEKNRVYKNDLDATQDGWWDGGIWLDGGRDIKIIQNTLYDNIGPGILISDEDKQKPKGYILKNNVSRNNYFGIYVWNFGVNNWPDKSIISTSNNSFSNNKVKNIIIHDWGYDPNTL